MGVWSQVLLPLSFFGVCVCGGKGWGWGVGVPLSCVTLHDNRAFLSAAGIVYNVLRVCVGVILLVSDDVYTNTMATLIPGSLNSYSASHDN